MNLQNTIGCALITTSLVSATAVPSLARAIGPTSVDHLHGTVSSFDGRYDLHLLDRNGVSTDVRLHPGTVIRPRGLTLSPGMRVSVAGGFEAEGRAVDAKEIDAKAYRTERVVVAPAYSPFLGASYGMGTPVRRRVVVANQ